jgi:hypothetical protein
MLSLPEALAPLSAYNQFILWKLVPQPDGSAPKKLPVDWRTASVDNAHNPEIWLDATSAMQCADLFGDDHGVGFVFTANDPFFFVDIDKCLEPTNQWSPLANTLMSMFPGAAIEVSQSGRGLHIIGKGVSPDHSCKNVPLGIEFYTQDRFVALTGTNAVGDANIDCSASLSSISQLYFPPSEATEAVEWTDKPVEGYTSTETDVELIERALKSSSAGSIFSNSCSFADLWNANEAALANAYPDEGGRVYDASSADAALAQHLAFWTGNNCERIAKMMWQSALVRDKWTLHKNYLNQMTITRAVALQTSFYSVNPVNTEGEAIAEQFNAPALRGSDTQKEWGNRVRLEKLAQCGGDKTVIEQLCNPVGHVTQAKFWIDARDKTPVEIVAALKPIESTRAVMSASNQPEMVEGFQYMGATLQIEHFKGCVYVQDANAIFTPNGTMLEMKRFNATYGGYTFQLDEMGDKTTRKAWEAFTESQIIRFTKVTTTCFRPELEPGTIVVEEGREMVNSYVPVNIVSTPGDATPFLIHLAKVLPVESDRNILLSYMAACVQHKGVKFQWAPLLQGAEGNGKTLFTRCVAYAVGKRYTHLPPANEIAEKFNDWLFGKLFIGIEDVYVSEHKKEIIEVLKPMITNDDLAKRAMQQSQIMSDNRANFMLNSNHRDGIRKTRNDRRFAVFYTAQQSAEDVTNAGMRGDYFPDLYQWLRTGGYAIVANYLTSYVIPDELNPATKCNVAPDTSSTTEAITAGLGSIEQAIIEVIDEGREPGFLGGWISSIALDRFLHSINAGRSIPVNKRRELLKSLGYDWHPALTQGRVNNITSVDSGKPRLFIREGHIHGNLESPAEVSRLYETAQGALVTAQGAAVFGNNRNQY